ncbi:MAG: hypothetical protein HY223_05220 [Thaumarchaeota archaeon]|nr:hypothetical protein [Nitrososphaerota archaeon]
MSENKSVEETNSDETFAFLNILNILSDTTKFRQWLSDFHELKEHDRFFEGYKFTIITSLLAFMNSFTMHDPFKLQDDEICYRAEFRGIKLEKLPNSCEKIIFQKNVWQLGRKIRKSTDWKNLDVKNELFPLLDLFNKIKKNHLQPTKNISETEALTHLSEFYTYLFLIDTSLGRPKGYYHPFFSTERNPKYLDKVFEGYVYSLQFLWYQMLGSDVFANSCVKDLHRCQAIKFQDEDNHSINLGEVFEMYEPELSPEEKKEQEFWRHVKNKWDSIDQFFSKIRSELIRPLEDKIGHRFGGLGKGLVKLVNFEKAILGSLLDKTNLEEPSFMDNDDLESMKKRLDVEFLWYDIDVFDAGQANLEFNGVFAFIALLTGYVTILEEQNSEGKVKVMKIIHPDIRGDHNYYSVAVLIGSYGFFSDASGWIVFYDSLIDSPGEGGHHRDMCFDCINKFKNQSRVELKEITVNKQIFQKYLESRKISFANSKDLSTIYKEVADNVAQVKGKLFEYVFLKYCMDDKKYDLVKGDFSLSGQQIDCIGVQGEIVYVFECKLQIHDNLEEYVEQINRISNLIKKEYPNKKIIPKLVVYSPVLENRSLELEKKGIGIIHSFKNAIQTDRVFDGERKKLLHTLDFELKDKFYRNYDKDWFT